MTILVLPPPPTNLSPRSQFILFLGLRAPRRLPLWLPGEGAPLTCSLPKSLCPGAERAPPSQPRKQCPSAQPPRAAVLKPGVSKYPDPLNAPNPQLLGWGGREVGGRTFHCLGSSHSPPVPGLSIHAASAMCIHLERELQRARPPPQARGNMHRLEGAQPTPT